MTDDSVASMEDSKGDIEDCTNASGEGSSGGSGAGELPWEWFSAEDIDVVKKPERKKHALDTDDDFDSLFLRSSIEDEMCSSASSSFKSLDTENLHWPSKFVYPPENPDDNMGVSSLDLQNMMITVYEQNHLPSADQTVARSTCSDYYSASEYSPNYQCHTPAVPDYDWRRSYNPNRPFNPRSSFRRRRGRGNGHRGGFNRGRNSFRSDFNYQSKPCYRQWWPSTFDIGVWGETSEEQQIQMVYDQMRESFGPYDPSPILPFIGNFEIGVWNEAPFAENYRARKGDVMYTLMESEKRRIEQEIITREMLSNIAADGEPFKPCSKSYDPDRHRREGDSAYDTASTTSSDDGKQRFFNADTAETTDDA